MKRRFGGAIMAMWGLGMLLQFYIKGVTGSGTYLVGQYAGILLAVGLIVGGIYLFNTLPKPANENDKNKGDTV